MRKAILWAFIFGSLAGISYSQTTSDCPAGLVCLTPAEMKFYLARDDKAKAQEIEITTLKKALDDTKQITNDIKVELAKATGTLTGVQQSLIDQRAVIQVLSANCKARHKIGIFNF